MVRSSKLSIGSPYKIQNKIGRLLQAYYSSMLEQPVPSELKSLVVQLLAIETREPRSTAQATEMLQLAVAPVGQHPNRKIRSS
jgi:hypothetical protein